MTKKSANIFLSIILLTTLPVLCYVSVAGIKKNGGLDIYFLNVGQGDSTYIRNNDVDVLIDGGPNKKVLSELAYSKGFFNKEIDIVIATHADSDHVAGLVDVVNRYNVQLFIEPYQEKDSQVFEELHKVIKEKNIKVVYAMYGQSIDLGSDAKLDVTHPREDSIFEDNNDASVVLVLTYKNQKVLLTGDATLKSESEYIDFLPQEEFDILKAGHHGSNTSTGVDLLEKITPKIAIISVGKDNKYGHPSPDTLTRLNNFKTKIYRTDIEGRLHFVLDGENIYKK